MNFSLSDLVPPLRWSDATRIPELRHPELPAAWWRALPMSRVLARTGPAELAKLLTELTLAQWPAAAIGDVLPALHVLDPQAVDDPHVARLLERAGSWPGLLALTGHDLREQPFISAGPVLTALFDAVLTRLVDGVGVLPPAVAPESPAAEPEPRREPEPAAAEPVAEPPVAKPAAAEPAVPEEPEPAPEERAPEEPAPAAVPPPAPPRIPYAAPARASGRKAEPEPAPAAEPPAPVPAPAAVPADDAPEHLPALIDAAFADLDDADWAVAQNLVFSPEPAAPEALAKLFAVSPEEIEARTAGVRSRTEAWLASDRAAPYRAHLERMAEVLGAASPKRRLIAAASWHREQLRSLDIPAWQFVLTTLPGYRLDGDWVIAGDPRELRARTRELLRNLDRPPSPAKAVELVASLGIHPEAAKAWLESMPPLPQDSAAPEEPPVPAPAAAPRASATVVPRAVPDVPAAVESPVPAAGADGEDSLAKPFGQLKDVALTRRCFRQPDGRWWLRVDVTEEHLAGGECPLPSGFAAYLGLTPGSSRTVRSASGDATLSWQNRPVIVPVNRLFKDIGAVIGGHVFLTLSDEGVLRARHLAPVDDSDALAAALRLVGYTAPGGTLEQAVRVIATRIGIPGPVTLPDLLPRLRERGDRDLLALLQ